MINYTIRRILVSVPVLFGILIVTFSLVRLIPGDPCHAMLGEKATKEICDRFLHDKGYDQPIPVQFAIYLGDVLRGDLGNSIRDGRPVVDILIERLPVTAELSISAFMIAVLLGVPIGIISARYHNSWADVSSMIGANIGVSMPVFWLGLMLAYLFGVVFKGSWLWLPPSARITTGVELQPFYEMYGWNLSEDTSLFRLMQFLSNFYVLDSILTLNLQALGDILRHLILPAFALGTIPLAIIARMTRSSLLEVLGLDYVRAARAKGLIQRIVIMRHAFRNALLPVVTIMGLQLGLLLSGAVLTETVFKLSGIGLSLYEGITGRNYPVITGFTLILASVYVLINLIVDLSYAFLDPRIRLE